MGEPCSQGPRTHLQPRNSQCIQNQLTTSMMREMGKLKRNQVPKLTTSAAGYWLEGKEPGQWLEKGGLPCSIWGLVNEDHGIWSHHFMADRWGNNGNSVIFLWRVGSVRRGKATVGLGKQIGQRL